MGARGIGPDNILGASLGAGRLDPDSLVVIGGRGLDTVRLGECRDVAGNTIRDEVGLTSGSLTNGALTRDDMSGRVPLIGTLENTWPSFLGTLLSDPDPPPLGMVDIRLPLLVSVKLSRVGISDPREIFLRLSLALSLDSARIAVGTPLIGRRMSRTAILIRIVV